MTSQGNTEMSWSQDRNETLSKLSQVDTNSSVCGILAATNNVQWQWLGGPAQLQWLCTALTLCQRVLHLHTSYQ